LSHKQAAKGQFDSGPLKRVADSAGRELRNRRQAIRAPRNGRFQKPSQFAVTPFRSLVLSARNINHAIMVTEKGGTAQTEIAAGGEALFNGRDRAGTVSVVPADVERCAAYRHADIRCCILWIRPEIARHVGSPNLPAC
jgi:hypothetical protein